jgi:hypothetical protein
MHAGTKATSALSSVMFMAISASNENKLSHRWRERKSIPITDN